MSRLPHKSPMEVQKRLEKYKAEETIMSYLRDEGATKDEVLAALKSYPEMGKRIHQIHFALFFSEPHDDEGDFDEDTD